MEVAIPIFLVLGFIAFVGCTLNDGSDTIERQQKLSPPKPTKITIMDGHPHDCMCDKCQLAYIESRRAEYEKVKRAKERAEFIRITEEHLKGEYGIKLEGSPSMMCECGRKCGHVGPQDSRYRRMDGSTWSREIEARYGR